MVRELPPTAGLPLSWRDLLGKSGFARGVAEFVGAEAAQIECSGTASLIVILSALAARSSRRVVVIPAYTCPLVPLAVAHAGLEVRLCDVRPDRFDFDEGALARACGPDTLAVVPAHFAGLPCDLAPVLAIARAAGATVVEDAAQAFGARWQGRAVGTVGDVGFYSFARGKGLTLYEGGAIVARDPDLLAACRATSARIVPRRPFFELLRCIELVGYRLFYNPFGLRFVYGAPLRKALAHGDPVRAIGDEFSCDLPLHRVSRWRQRVGAAALPRLASALQANATRAARRGYELRARGVAVLEPSPGDVATWPVLVVRMPSEAARDAALATLWTAGLGVSRLFVHALPGYRYLDGIVPKSAVPNADALAATTLTVTNHAWLDDATFTAIADVLVRRACPAAPR